MHTTTSSPLSPPLHVALLPFPGRGHINPLLSLSHHLSSLSLLSSLILTDEWARLLSHSSSPLSPLSRFAMIPNVLPSELVRGTEYDEFTAAVYTKMAEPVERLIEAMEPRVDLIVSDVLLPWAQGIGQRIGVPVVAFFPQSATEFFALVEFGRLDHGLAMDEDLTGEMKKLLEYTPFPRKDPNPDLEHCNLEITREFVQLISWSFKSKAILLSSFYDLEKSALDALKSQVQTPIYPIGPLIIHQSSQKEENISNYMNWLDSKPTQSVVYIALGSFLPLSKEQFNEMIVGLNLSKHPYLLVLREIDEETTKIIGDNGLIVSWCDQLKVLSHHSIGGFLTHCGWNSVLEAIYTNVPLITFPIAFDQVPNSNLIVDDWRVGMKLKGGNRKEIVKRAKIESIVKKVMNLDGNGSKEIRSNMRELHEKCLKALEKNGCLNSSINDFVQHVVSCKKLV